MAEVAKGDPTQGRLEGLFRELGYEQQKGRVDRVAAIKAEIAKYGGKVPKGEAAAEEPSPALGGVIDRETGDLQTPETTDMPSPEPRPRTPRRRKSPRRRVTKTT